MINRIFLRYQGSQSHLELYRTKSLKSRRIRKCLNTLLTHPVISGDITLVLQVALIFR